jgi:nitroreductase
MGSKNIILGISCAAGIFMTGCCGNSCKSDESATAESTNGSAAIENIMTRTSIRQYDADRTISADTIEVLLKAAMAAPTAVNRQPWAFVVVDDRATMDSLKSVCPNARMLDSASLAIVTCGDMDLALEGPGRDFWIQDLSAATENLLLAAHAMGLGAVWTGVYPDSTRVAGVARVLGLPESIVPLAVVPLGYPAENPEPKDKWDATKVHHNKWTAQ